MATPGWQRSLHEFSTDKKKPRLSRYKTGAEVLRDAEGDQTMRRALSSEASVPAELKGELAENDLFIGIPDIADLKPCRRSRATPESTHIQ